jgi:hypothetical protein
MIIMTSSMFGKYTIWSIIRNIFTPNMKHSLYPTDTVNGLWTSLLTKEQIVTIQWYMVKYGVKMVRLNDYPDVSTGVTPVGNGMGTSLDQTIAIDTVAATLATTVGLSPLSTFSSEYLYHYPGQIVDSRIATPVLRFKPAGEFVNDTIAAAVSTINLVNIGNYSQLAFYLPFNPVHPTSVHLGKMWLSWVSNGAFPPSAKPLASFSIQQKVLVVSFPQDDMKAVSIILKAYSMPFDQVILGQNSIPPMEKVPNSVGAYSLVVLTGRMSGECHRLFSSMHTDGRLNTFSVFFL